MDKETLAIKGSLFFLYMGQLVELGLIEGDGPKLTTKGFNVGIDAYDSGERLDDKDILRFLKDTGVPSEIEQDFLILINHIQEIGIVELRKNIAKISKKEDN